MEVAEQYEIVYTTQLEMTKELNVTSDVIRDFIYEWQLTHQHYHILYNNCQEFAQDFSREVFHVKIVTQSDEVLELAKNVLKLGLVTVFIAGMITMYGLLLKQSEMKNT